MIARVMRKGRQRLVDKVLLGHPASRVSGAGAGCN